MPYNHRVHQDRVALASAIILKLEESGFIWGNSDMPRQERVYTRDIEERLSVQVYTSIVGNQVRLVGEDAIRVAGVYLTKEGQHKGLTSDTRINRVGEIPDIVDRMIGRMRDVWKATHVVERCDKCNAPLFISRKGNKVCAELCWLKAGPGQRNVGS